MKVLIIDGQGGKIGRALTESIKKYDESIHVLAIGTNSMATAAMNLLRLNRIFWKSMRKQSSTIRNFMSWQKCILTVLRSKKHL